MTTVSRRTLVRAAAVTACAGALLAVPVAAALAEGMPAAPAGTRAPGGSPSLADGRLSSWVGAATPGPEGQAPAGNGALLLAAGGGIAAVGAAGLGFAMLRRGRTDA
ncbi:hypothetical protein [Streptomyces sp. NPDC054838]